LTRKRNNIKEMAEKKKAKKIGKEEKH